MKGLLLSATRKLISDPEDDHTHAGEADTKDS